MSYLKIEKNVELEFRIVGSAVFLKGGLTQTLSGLSALTLFG
jgi:hypothetical protein